MKQAPRMTLPKSAQAKLRSLPRSRNREQIVGDNSR